MRGLWCALVLAAVQLGCAGPTVSLAPDAPGLPPNVAAVAVLPVDIGYGGPSEHRRIQRRTEDALMALAGGRAILAAEIGAALGEKGELTAPTDQEITRRLRGLGEIPERVLTFAVLASRSRRLVANAASIAGFQMGRHLVIDYTVRLEVRQVGRAEVLGSIDSVTAGDPNEPDFDSRGNSRGVQKAIDDAVARAVSTFAPALAPRTPADAQLLIAEVPAAAAATALDRTQALGDLYPELSIEQLQALAGSRQPFLVIRPGTLAAMGLAAGDLVGPVHGQTLVSRAALARGLARGALLKVVVERAGQRYLLAAAEARP